MHTSRRRGPSEFSGLKETVSMDIYLSVYSLHRPGDFGGAS